jgi:hypothetical protein
MRIRAVTAIASGLLLALPDQRSVEAQEIAPAAPAPATCQRLVEFRDGSILRIDLPAAFEFEFRQTSGESGGQLDSSPVRLDHPQSIRFSRLPALKQLNAIHGAIAGLGAENFKLRERALHTLVTGGHGFRPFLEDLFVSITDPESRWRLAAALNLLPPHHGIYEHAYDEMVTVEGTSKGDVDQWEINATYRNAPIKLDRDRVRAIRHAPPLSKRGGTPIVATTEIIRKDLDVLFPEDCIRIDFEEDSQGVPLREGQDISRRFIFDGLLLETSVEDSFVSVNDHAVSGRSGGQSAATHLPLYQGTITLTFCVPGNEHELGGVTHVGLSAAIVQKGGTTLAAFDASGHRIASVVTVDGPHQFLGLRSNVPIHQLQIIPGSDPDYTFDDLVFDVPKAIDTAGAASAHSLELATGERIVCDRFRIEGETVTAAPASKFAGEISFPAADLVQLRTPTDGHQKLPPDEGERFWMMLTDGSTLLATESGEDQPPLTLLQGIPVGTLPIAALWSEAGDLAPLPKGTKLEKGQVAIIITTVPSFLTDPVLTAEKFTATDDDATVEYSYNRLPTVWLKPPDRAVRDRATGFVRLNTGERIVLGGGATFQLESYDPQAVTLTNGKKVLRIPLDTISTLRLPRQ